MKVPERPVVLMVSSYPPDTDGIASYTSRLVHALRAGEWALVKNARKGKEWKPNSLTYFFAILRSAIRLNVDIVHIQASYFMFGSEYYTGLLPILILALRFLRKICIVTVHDIVAGQNVTTSFLKRYTDSRFLDLKRLAFLTYTTLICRVSHMVIVHEKLASDVLVSQYNIPNSKVKVIPHGIDSEQTNSERNNDNLVVTYFGLIRHGKGLEDLIEAWPIVLRKLDASLQIVGGKHPFLQDDCYEKLVQLVDKLRLNSSVVFCGFVPDNNLYTYLANTDTFVFPYNEWGDVIASSGALSIVAPFKKPMVVTDVPAFAVLKRSKSAVVVDRGDIDSLGNAIVRTLIDSQLRNTLIKRLDELLLGSSWSSVAKRTASLYGSLLRHEEMSQ